MPRCASVSTLSNNLTVSVPLGTIPEGLDAIVAWINKYVKIEIVQQCANNGTVTVPVIDNNSTNSTNTTVPVVPPKPVLNVTVPVDNTTVPVDNSTVPVNSNSTIPVNSNNSSNVDNSTSNSSIDDNTTESNSSSSSNTTVN